MIAATSYDVHLSDFTPVKFTFTKPQSTHTMQPGALLSTLGPGTKQLGILLGGGPRGRVQEQHTFFIITENTPETKLH